MIDHVVVDHHWQVRKAWIEYHKQGEQWPSDHFPVAAVISLAAAAAE
jgi:endonuclease/exonuclease/phosphatase family metal-dependent hydrolase